MRSAAIRCATAHPNHNQISNEDVEGTAVYGPGDDNVGDIGHLMVEKMSGRVLYEVMTFGGFLSLGQSHYAIPWAALKYDTALGGYRTGITEPQLRRAPAFGNDAWGDRDWERRTHEHYQEPSYWELGPRGA